MPEHLTPEREAVRCQHLVNAYGLCQWCHKDKNQLRIEELETEPDRLDRELEAVRTERDALRLVHIEARELIGEADATGEIPAANLNALRSLLWRASLKRSLA